ncbi:MAG: PKD domain-containing protein, partial [Flavobacteriales bacterium]
SYTWTPEGPVVSPALTTTYSVVATDANNCQSAPAQVTVTVPADQAILVSHTSLDGCAPHCITFTAASSAANRYSWDFGDGNSASDSIVEHCYTIAGEYTVNLLVQQASGCPNISSTVGPFTIHASPDAQFILSPAAPTISDPQVQFTDLSVDASTWAWSFGDPAGSVSTDPSPAFTFPGEGCYPVTLVVMNDAGCADSTQAQVCVLGTGELVVPNIFTPNNDGRNDVFRINGGDLTSLEVQIFNRWGQQVALLQRVNQVWDGRSPAGEVLTEGTYFYTLRAQDKEGKSYDLSGAVTLVR